LLKKQQGMRLPSKERHSCASCMVDWLCADDESCEGTKRLLTFKIMSKALREGCDAFSSLRRCMNA
jgi:hypothetical protein